MSGTLTRIGAMVRKEVRHILRDHQSLAIVIAMPIVMMFLYGYALTLDVTDARIVLEDPTHEIAARRVAGSLDASTYFQVAAVVDAVGDVKTALHRYDAKAVVKFPPHMDRRLGDGAEGAVVRVLIDGADQNVGTLLMNALPQAIRDAVLEHLHIEPPEPVVVRTRVLYNPRQRSALYFVPGLMAIILVLTSALLTTLTITREKEYGTMEQMLVSPVRPWEILVGKLAPYVVLAAIDGALILTVGYLFFGLTVRGSPLFLAASGTLYIVVALLLGLIFSTLAKTQQQAMLMVLPTTLMPTVVLSGFIFPLRSMPVLLQVISRAIPATYFLEIIRAIVLKGTGVVELWRPVAGLAALGCVFLTISIVTFRSRP